MGAIDRYPVSLKSYFRKQIVVGSNSVVLSGAAWSFDIFPSYAVHSCCRSVIFDLMYPTQVVDRDRVSNYVVFTNKQHPNVPIWKLYHSITDNRFGSLSITDNNRYFDSVVTEDAIDDCLNNGRCSLTFGSDKSCVVLFFDVTSFERD